MRLSKTMRSRARAIGSVFLAEAPVGSRLVFTFVQKAFLDRTAQFGLSARSQVVRVRDQCGTSDWSPIRSRRSWPSTAGEKWSRWDARRRSPGTRCQADGD